MLKLFIPIEFIQLINQLKWLSLNAEPSKQNKIAVKNQDKRFLKRISLQRENNKKNIANLEYIYIFNAK